MMRTIYVHPLKPWFTTGWIFFRLTGDDPERSMRATTYATQRDGYLWVKWSNLA